MPLFDRLRARGYAGPAAIILAGGAAVAAIELDVLSLVRIVDASYRAAFYEISIFGMMCR